MSIKMIVTDLDRTLLRTDKTISDYTVGVLNRCRKHGIKIVFATARPVRLTERLCKSFKPDAIIADNGALTDCNGLITSRIIIPAETLNLIIKDIMKGNKATSVIVETGTSILSNYTGKPWDNDWNAWNLIYTDFSQEISVQVTKICVECNDVVWLKQLLNNYPNLHIYLNSGENWSQIMHHMATKLNALNQFAKYSGTLIEEIIVFGDDYNDIEILKNCGIGVAVSNGLKEAKAAANYVCDTNDNDGVAKWIEEHLLHNYSN